jgi:uncharacterized protein YndB with AHSA1/START domain
MKRTINLTLDIDSPPSTIFAALIDLPSYNQWLPQSGVFKGTTEVSETPVRTGTRYEEHSPAGTRYGEVVELDAQARHVVFHQPMKLRPYALGLSLDVTVDMVVLDRDGGGATLNREIRLGIPAVLAVAHGIIADQFRVESLRTMQVLKEFLEKQGAAGAAKEA